MDNDPVICWFFENVFISLTLAIFRLAHLNGKAL